jgi:hypothetical protein
MINRELQQTIADANIDQKQFAVPEHVTNNKLPQTIIEQMNNYIDQKQFTVPELWTILSQVLKPEELAVVQNSFETGTTHIGDEDAKAHRLLTVTVNILCQREEQLKTALMMFGGEMEIPKEGTPPPLQLLPEKW